MAAAAAEYKMFTCFQDLTCIGGSFLHSAALSSHIPRVAAIEGNGRQYCPVGNQAYMKHYAPMFRVRYGTVPTDLLSGVGLGFDWQELKAVEPAPESTVPTKSAAEPTAAKPTSTSAATSKAATNKATSSKTTTDKAATDKAASNAKMTGADSIKKPKKK